MEREINYKGIFVAGCSLLSSGVILSLFLGPVGIAIIGCGLGMIAIGLAKRGGWD